MQNFCPNSSYSSFPLSSLFISLRRYKKWNSKKEKAKFPLFTTFSPWNFWHLSSFAGVTDGGNHTDCRRYFTSFVFHTFNSVFSQNTFSLAKRVENNFLAPLLFFIPFLRFSSSQMPPKTKDLRNGFFLYSTNGLAFFFLPRILHKKSFSINTPNRWKEKGRKNSE